MTSNPKQIADRPRDIATCVAAYLKTGDLEGVLSMFHPECQIHFLPGEPPALGLDGARKIFQEFVPLRPILKSNISSELINGDTALLLADWVFEDAEGNILTQGSSTEVARRLENGGWGYYIDCPNGPPKLSK
ncbi:nuclear transport factor 2 family protein [uncultured Ruegeria sp.]|uniref:YybH family protein n=1 Tax=uncultured Ruegeria sp. TaxID=259304 RepID=UPI00345567B1